jgi:hypothetical protein
MVVNDKVVTIRVARAQVELHMLCHLAAALSSVGLHGDDEPMQALQPLLDLAAGVKVTCMAMHTIFMQLLELAGTAKTVLVGI